EDLRLWRPMFSQVEYFANAKFYIIKAKFIDEQRSRHETEIGFDALARLKSGRFMWIRALQTVQWKQSPAVDAGKPPTWHIYGWRTDQFATMEADRLLFEEVSDRALAPSDLARARRSVHEELVLRFLLDEKNFK